MCPDCGPATEVPRSRFRFLRFGLGGALARGFGGRRLARGGEHDEPGREHTTTVFVEVDDRMVFVDFDEGAGPVVGLNDAIAFGPRLHRCPMLGAAEMWRGAGAPVPPALRRTHRPDGPARTPAGQAGRRT